MRAALWTMAVLAVLAVSPLHAQDAQDAQAAPPASPPPPPAEPSPSASPTPAPRPPFVAGYRNGFTLQSETGDFVLKVTGYVQADGRFLPGDDTSVLASVIANQFLVRRARPILQGTVARYFDFYLNPDFGSGTTVLQDAFVDVRFTPRLRFRAGKIKTPFGIERLQSAQSLLFVERALPNNLVPNRDVGLQVHGELLKGAVGYQLAVLNGVPDGGSVDIDTNGGKDLAGRLFLQPWRNKGTSPLRGLGFGVSATTGTATGPLRPYVSVSQVPVFAYATTVTASGDRKRWSPQASFFLGPVGVIAEYVEARHEVQKVETGRPTTTAELQNSAWSVTASVLLTGEEASYGSVKPKNFFVPSAGKWGAWQLVARLNRLEVDDETFAGGFADPARAVGQARAWGVGLDWIWNSNLKYVLDYEQTRFSGGAAGGTDRPTENSVQTRLQLSF
jgi:phosphate-selective porin OprO/OprP